MTPWLLFCSGIDNMAFLLFQCQQHGCQSKQQLVRQGEVTWLLERLFESSYARVTSIKSQQTDRLSDGRTRQPRQWLDLGLIKIKKLCVVPNVSYFPWWPSTHYYKTFNDLVSSNSLETIGDHDLISSLQKCSLKKWLQYVSNHLMIIMMVAVNFFVTSKSHQQPSEGRGDVSARQLPLDLVWFLVARIALFKLFSVQQSALILFSVQLFSYSAIQFARELVWPGNSLCPY